MKKIALQLPALFLIGSMLLGACAPAKTAAPAATTAPKAEPPVEIHFAYVTFNRVSEALESVESAINAITVPKINVKVKLHPYAIANYNQQISLSLQSGEALDVFHTLGDLPQYVSQNKVLDITSMIDKDAPEAKAIVGDTFLKASTINGRLYGIPAYKGVALAPNLAYRADILQEIGVDPSSIKSVNDLTDVYAKVKAKYPDMVPLVPTNVGAIGLVSSLYGVDYLGSNMYSPMGVLMGDSMKVVDLYQTQEFKDRIALAREWYTKGYILKDAATSTSTSLELMTSGKAFSYVASYAGHYAATQISGQTGQKIGMVRIAQPYLGTASVSALTWSVSSTSKHPDAALKFMNLIFSDKAVINLIIWGLEGRDYVKVDADHVKYPDGQDANTVPYTAAISNGIIGNQFIQYQTVGTDMSDLQLMLSENKNSAVSPAFGFTFDNSSVTNETSAVLNVINEYLPGLNTGVMDPAVELPKFIAKLKAAGLDKINAAKQEQLDKWASQKK
jgi:putative aldouronate transport system substrate-binding protein